MVDKPKMELVDCAQALMKVNLTTPIGVLQELIEEGYLHLAELKAVSRCNYVQVAALEHRIRRAEEVLQRKASSQT